MSVWNAVATLSSVCSTLIVAIAALYAGRQVSEVKHTRAITSLVALHQEYQSAELSRVRRRLRANELGDFTRLSADDREGLDNLLQKLELLAVLTNRGLLEVEDVAALFPGIPTTFALLRPYVDLHRSARPRYAAQTGMLVGRYC
ncbi:DUF4760 domain-containing protein [Streptomyces kutzneri]|uniref:DUF4760 domain-containing protein n=1 Tax=Streptomyces kutzneri TaxID=3051179 RepID=UPI0028D5B9EA|nr:hypothetical protein [Streptomyces sp. DSM 40907]